MLKDKHTFTENRRNEGILGKLREIAKDKRLTLTGLMSSIFYDYADKETKD